VRPVSCGWCRRARGPSRRDGCAGWQRRLRRRGGRRGQHPRGTEPVRAPPVRGSAWRWSHQSDEQLEPRGCSTGATSVLERRIELPGERLELGSLLRDGAWFVPRCGEEDRYPAAGEACVEWPCCHGFARRSFRRRGWRQTDLGDCASCSAEQRGGRPCQPRRRHTARAGARPADAPRRGRGRRARTEGPPRAHLQRLGAPDFGRHCYESAAPPRGAQRFASSATHRSRERAGRARARDLTRRAAPLLELPAAAPLIALELFVPDPPRRSEGSSRPRSGRRRQ
jgi:hypothetical protein